MIFYAKPGFPLTWGIHTSKVTYTTAGEVNTSDPAFYTNNPAYQNVVVTDITLTDEQLERFGRVKSLDIPLDALETYVMLGQITNPALENLAGAAQIDQAQKIVEKYVNFNALDAATYADLLKIYSEYDPNFVYYPTGKIFIYQNELWRVIQGHPTQPDYVPNQNPALYIKIPLPGQIPDWVQPYGGSGTYVLGARVRFEGHIYENIYTGQTYNVWSPTDLPAGWLLIE